MEYLFWFLRKISIIFLFNSHLFSEIDQIDFDVRKDKNDYSYDYYCHFEGFNRRNDQWVTRDNIELVSEIF